MSSSPAPASGAAPHLSNSALNLVALRDFYRSEIVRLLNLPGVLQAAGGKDKKALILDRSLIGPLGLVVEASLLSAQGVDAMHDLGGPVLASTATHIQYLLRPTLANMRLVASHIQNHRARDPPGQKRCYSLFFVPRKSLLCEKELESLGVLGDIRHMEEVHMELLPFDEDVLSMELPSAFRETALDGDTSLLLDVARALMKLQAVFGLIPTVRGKGNNAHKVFHLMQRLRREGGFHTTPGSTAGGAAAGEIDSLILLDRSVDLVTPLLTQHTYEGLLDEVFGVKNSYIDVDAEIVGGGKNASSPTGAASAAPAQPATKKLLLNSADSLFKETRDLPFRVLGPLLHRKAEYIASTYADRHATQTVTELKSYMDRFKSAHAEHSLLQTHINLAERVSAVFRSKSFDARVEVERWCCEGSESDACESYIEAAIAKGEPLCSVLRLLCLFSLTSGGLKSKRFDSLRRDVLHTYGFPTLFTLNNLERLGMLAPSERGRSSWAAVRRQLRLVTPAEEVPNLKPESGDIGLVYNGIAPLAVRLVELAHKPGWRRVDDVLSALPGKTFEYVQEVGIVPTNPTNRLDKAYVAAAAERELPTPSAATPASKDAAAAAGAGGKKKPLTLVFFLGGCTLAEISALRLLSEREDHPRDYIVCTTKLLNGSTLVESVQEAMMPPKSIHVAVPLGQQYAPVPPASGAAAAQPPPTIGKPTAAIGKR